MTFHEQTAIECSQEIYEEMADASSKFPPFNSGHEGFAVIEEEVDELWEAVKLNQKRHPERDELMRKECIQVGAMALRFLHDMKLKKEGPAQRVPSYLDQALNEGDGVYRP